MRRDTLLRWLVDSGGNVALAARRHRRSKQLLWYHVHRMGLTQVVHGLRFRLEREPPPPPPPRRPDPERSRLREDRARQVLELLDRTGSIQEAARVLGVGRSSIWYHVRKLGLREQAWRLTLRGRWMGPRVRFLLPPIHGAA